MADDAPATPSAFVNLSTYDLLDRLRVRDLDATGSTPSRLVTRQEYDGNENRTLTTPGVRRLSAERWQERLGERLPAIGLSGRSVSHEG